MIRFTTALLATTFFASTAFAQTTPLPKNDRHSSQDAHNHSKQSDTTAKDVPFAVTEAPDDHVMGSDKAPITMIVWASITCPHCSDWFTNDWPSIKKELIETGKIRFVFRELPTQPAQLAMVGFMMAQCAPKEDYFSLIEYQMENQKMIFEAAEKGEARAEYDKIAKLAGLDNEDDINACLADQDKLAHIHTNSERANGAAIQGVPAFYVNGERYDGKQDAETLIKLIETMDSQGLSALPTSMPKE